MVFPVPIDRLLDDDGFQHFMRAAPKLVLHSDMDKWGMPRRLVRVPMRFEEDVHAVHLYDEGSRKTVYLRVPPSMRTCQEAVAWTFGMKPHEYDTHEET